MLKIVLLAGGLGKRMNSEIAKVLHLVGGQPMILRILNECYKLRPDSIYIIVGKYEKAYNSIDLEEIKGINLYNPKKITAYEV
jgi:bifunctional N-acetylglucosamine-1-phosphate-uridyltransferase/glucosamine-1-phosphate-acetyltransferase GlmU-like protein